MNNNMNRIEENEFTLNTLLTKKGAESIQILNEIDFLVTHASTIPLTSKVMVDAETLFSLTEKFRQCFPKDLEQAEIVINEVQEIVADAEAKAEIILSDAEQKAHMILNESRIMREAQERASVIINDALYAKNQMQQEAENYVYSLFSEAEQNLLAGAGAIKSAVKSMRNA